MCKCEQKTDFKVALRSALAATTETTKMAVWENNGNKEIYFGEVDQAKIRLEKGTIDCYFIPKKEGEIITFDIIDQKSNNKHIEQSVNSFSENSGALILQDKKATYRKQDRNKN